MTDNTVMETAKLELEEAVERLTHNVRDPEAAKRSSERMDRMREELRQKIGTVDEAVELIRDAREGCES